MPDKTYAEVVEQNRQALAHARLNDPAEHFPYKHDIVMGLLAEGENMGPGEPGGVEGVNDDSRSIEDYMSAGIADASRDYIDAQAAYLTDGSEQNKAAYNAARDRLQAARLDHRQNRGQGFVVGAAARRAG
jgi:hypothetical protein